jgi:prefoldin subunit 5
MEEETVESLRSELEALKKLVTRLQNEIKQLHKDAREEAKDAYYAGVEQTREEYEQRF